jgi:hypothetical protein
VNQLVLSGTVTLVLSGTRSSCYRGPESRLSACFPSLSGRSNFTNQKSFGFLLTDRADSRDGGDRQRRPTSLTCFRKPRTHFTDRKAHGSHFELQGAAA